MGFPKIKLKAPKIKANPSKLITNAVQGVNNLYTTSVNSSIQANASVAGTALDGVGSVLSNPAAGAVLGGVGAAYGIPGLGSLASGFQSSTDNSGLYATPTVSSTSFDSGINQKTLLIAGGAGFGLLILVMVLNSKRG